MQGNTESAGDAGGGAATRPHRRAFWILAAAHAVLLLPGLFWGLPNVEGWEADSMAPVTPISACVSAVSGGFAVRYAPFHFYLSGAAYAPYLGYVYLSGDIPAVARAYPYGIQDHVRHFGVLIGISRLLSLIMALGAGAAVYRMGARLGSHRGGLLAMALFGSNVLAVAYGQTASLDVPYVFWAALGLDRLLALRDDGSKRNFVLAGVFAALAVATKDQAYGIFMLPFAFLVLGACRPALLRTIWPDRSQAAIRGGVIRLVAAFGVAYVLANDMVFNFDGFLEHVSIMTSSAKTTDWREFESGPAGQAMLAVRVLEMCGRALGPVTVFGLLGVVCAWRGGGRGRAAVVLAGLATVSYFATFLGVIGFVFPRFVLPFLLLGCPFAGFFLDRLVEKTAGRTVLRVLAIVTAAAGLLWSLLGGISVVQNLLGDSRYAVEARFRTEVDPTASVVFYSPADQPTYNPRIDQPSRTIPHRDMQDVDGLDERHQADYAVVILFRGTPEHEDKTLSLLEAEGSGWRRIERRRPSSLRDIAGLVPFISPEIRIYRGG